MNSEDLKTKLAAIIDNLYDEYSPSFNAEGKCVRSNIADAVFDELVPAHSLLVSFKTERQNESDWELGYSSAWTDLTDPELLAHQLEERELTELYFAIEQFGGLQESDAYHQLDKQIEALGEPTAQALRNATGNAQR